MRRQPAGSWLTQRADLSARAPVGRRVFGPASPPHRSPRERPLARWLHYEHGVVAGATMGLSWQHGPFGLNPNGKFLTASALPERLLYAEPLRRRMSVELGESIVARSDDAVLLFERGRYPVAYFPHGDVTAGVVHATRGWRGRAVAGGIVT